MRHSFARLALLCLVLSPALALHVGGTPQSRSRMTRPAASPPPAQTPNWGQEAWDRYVLLRPSSSDDENGEEGAGWWAGRTPGTARTILISSVICSFVALPALLTNPLVLTRLIELAALDRIGLTPAEMFERTGKFF